ncbi:hypothetical protein HMPREF9474_01240 [ [[Clostridium] symbiosum WAL-14163]|uniref:DUF7768 domain-containing protein n=1 Tax=Clostridium symbiosum (strain WAL-14163) TaxID=742740 RepID=E7GJZ5_CLOS6|nr:hypothetical protein HMPREF9474_01240 [ [[Clostridium] symbiosum WAL-14163]
MRQVKEKPRKGGNEDEEKIFICSPFRGDEEGNSVKAAGYCRRAYEEGHLPIAPHLLFPQFLNEDSLKERADGIAMGLELLFGCDEMWVFGEATEGMEQEIRFAVEHDIHIWFKENAEGGSEI